MSTTTSPRPLPRRVDEVRQAPLSLGVGEADVYLLAESLLGQRRLERFEVAPSSAAPSDTLTLALARLLPVGLLRFIGSQGGERAGRALRRNGQRVDVVDLALSDAVDDVAVDFDDPHAFTLRVSSAWPTAVWVLATDLMPLVEKRREHTFTSGLAGLGRTDRQRLRTSLPPPATLSGDHLAYACAVDCLPRLGLPTAFETLMARAFAAGSPLAHLYRLDDGELRHLDVDALLRPPLSRSLELLGPGLASSWHRQVRRVLSHSADIDEVIARCTVVSHHLTRLVEAMDRACRLDLLESVVAFLGTLAEAIPAETRGRLLRLPGVTTMADRDRVVAAVAGIFGVVDVVDRVAAGVATARFGDDRFVEARVTAGAMAPLAITRPALEAARRALTGVVG